MKSSEIRERYLQFFEDKGCKRMPSSSLIPDDPSMLLTSAGMVQFKPYFLQQKQLDDAYIGTTTCQKCLRTSDIDNIGATGRHLSFFEMLGNFSFGKYFKKEMCAWALEFSTDVLGFSLDRLYFSVFTDDDETVDIWRNLGISDDHIVRLGADDNFWTAGPTGPCGPCSELYYDQGLEYGCGKPDCAPGCDCDRYIEYWNCVFTQYDRQEDGTLVPLPKKNIDTGMGLERVAALTQGKSTNYESDILWSLIELAQELSNKKYGENYQIDMAMRIIADHSRAVSFMIADGILPSNEGRGYVLRRLLRRAVRYGHLLGIEGAFLNKFVDVVADLMGSAYSEVLENINLIKKVVSAEEDRFRLTLVHGQNYLDEAIDNLDGKTLSGEVAFALHDTYGFPIDMTIEICRDKGIAVDEAGFGILMTEQRERARSHVKDDAWSTYNGLYAEIAADIPSTEFVGYEQESCSGQVLAIALNGERVESVNAESLDSQDQVELFLDTTPFYGEMGGQVGDTGIIESQTGTELQVVDCTVPEPGFTSHKCTLSEGNISVGDKVVSTIDAARRARIKRNHTATHILHYALQKVLGDHVKQAGSLVAPNRLRFDFTHFESVSLDLIAEIEKIVNDRIMEDHLVCYYETSLDEAKRDGVTALFGEKYGEVVRVLKCGDFSKELCGGTHVSHTAEIGFLKITSESSIGSNTRRIEAVTSYDALAYVNERLDVLSETAAALKSSPMEVALRAQSNAKKITELERELKKAKAQANSAVQGTNANITKLDAAYDVEFVVFDGTSMDELKEFWDNKKVQTSGAYAVVCVSKTSSESVVLLAAGNDLAVEQGFDAGKVIKEISPLVGGRGGGKPKMAQAGGKDPSGIDKIAGVLTNLLNCS